MMIENKNKFQIWVFAHFLHSLTALRHCTLFSIDIFLFPLSLFYMIYVLNADRLSKYPQIKAAVSLYNRILWNLFLISVFTLCATAGCSGSPLVWLLDWAGCKGKAARYLTTKTQAWNCFENVNVSLKNREILNSVAHALLNKQR